MNVGDKKIHGSSHAVKEATGVSKSDGAAQARLVQSNQGQGAASAGVPDAISVERGLESGGARAALEGLAGLYSQGNDSGSIEKTKPPSLRDLMSPKVDPKAPGKPAVTKIFDKVQKTGDLTALNAIDNFRSRLTPEQQKAYDKELQKLRDNPNIVFEYHDGSSPNPNIALEDVALRGIAAASFNNPKLEGEVLKDSKEVDGKLNIHVYPDAVPLEDFHPGHTGKSGGLATPSNDIAVGQANVISYLGHGENVLLHEFAHLQQRVRADGSHKGERVPGDFPNPEGFAKAFSDPKFQDFLIEKYQWLGAKKPEDGKDFRGGQESWPSVQELYREFPEELKKASPELYKMMQEYTGFDLLDKPSTGGPIRFS